MSMHPSGRKRHKGKNPLNLKIPAGLLGATRLVRGGKLMEATAAIQRALGIGASPGSPNADSETDAIEGSSRRVVGDARPARAAARALDKAGVAPSPERGRFVSHNYTNEAGTRAYKLYIPAGYDERPMPLVVMLHGCRQNPDDFAAGTRMNALADEHGLIVVYPAQANHANVSGCWNWFQSDDQHRDQGEPSLIAGITREVIATHHVDADRVYVAGLSAGGAMAAIMGTTYPDLYAATGVHSGLAYAAAQDLPSAFAAMRGDPVQRPSRRGRHSSARFPRTIVFHGDSDTTVHPSNGHHVIAQGAAPDEKTATRGNAASGAWVKVERGEVRGRTYTRTAHLNGAGKTIMEHWVVHGAGHAWSGGSASGSFTDAKGPDASREMIRFFLQAR